MTQNILVAIPILHHSALQAALTASLGSLSTGVTTARDQMPDGVYLHLADAAQPADLTTAQTLAAAHDPVFLTIDKTSIKADGQDVCTVSVSAPKAGAAAVSLLIALPSGATTTQAVTMSNGVGSVQLKTQLYGMYSISVNNPSNRSTDVLQVQAV